MLDPRRHPHRRVLTIPVAAGVFLAACGADSGPTGGPVTAPPVTALAVVDDTAGGDISGSDTPDATAPATSTTTSSDVLDALLSEGDVIGDAIDLAAVDGRPVVAWFWAPWCTICRAEAPTIAEVAATYRDEVVLVGVPGRAADGDIRRFIDDTGTGSITHIADLGGDIWGRFGVFAQPAFAFISPDGDTDVFVGSLGENALIDRIDALTAT